MPRAPSLASLASLVLAPALAAQRPTVAQFLSPASPIELTSARRADRVAWTAYERGMRNVYTAAAPDFAPVRVTRFLDDDGTDVTDVRLSDDGSIVTFVRGHAPNRQGWVANPSHDPDGAERAVWAARTRGGAPWRVARIAAGAPEPSPDGRWVLWVQDGQIHRARVIRDGGPLASVDTGGRPLITQWGRQSSPRWSPDGRRIAFVSDRDNHAFVGIYDVRTHSVEFVAPSVDCDGSPTWSPDGRRVAFVRRPGVPFGAPARPAGASGCAGGGSGGSGRAAAAADSAARAARGVPGLHTAAFAGGYTTSLMVADVTVKPNALGGYPAREAWHDAQGDRTFASLGRMLWAAGDRVVFPINNVPGDEWERYFALDLAVPDARPVLLTTTDGLIEDATSAALSKDGRTLYYTTNASDVERRDVWAVPVDGGAPVQVTTGDGIETHPQPLASGRHVAVLYFGARQPASVGLVPVAGGEARLVFPTLPKDFPAAAHVTPEIVVTTAADGVESRGQLFVPVGLAPGERRPAIVFAHGGPRRQMMPGYHYMQFYHWAYAVNQWLASQGYVVLSVNYRGGVGYGRSFRDAAGMRDRGNAEYGDVLAAGRYLQTRADVDPSRVGIWGLSYGGLLTSQALARNSDVFVAGADLAGVHLYGSSLDSTALSYASSAISAIGTWRSPVFLVHGDDDRNVDFAQTVGLVQLLRARGVPHELIVIPDDVHESMLHSRWIETWERMGAFLRRHVWDGAPAAR